MSIKSWWRDNFSRTRWKNRSVVRSKEQITRFAQDAFPECGPRPVRIIDDPGPWRCLKREDFLSIATAAWVPGPKYTPGKFECEDFRRKQQVNTDEWWTDNSDLPEPLLLVRWWIKEKGIPFTHELLGHLDYDGKWILIQGQTGKEWTGEIEIIYCIGSGTRRES